MQGLHYPQVRPKVPPRDVGVPQRVQRRRSLVPVRAVKILSSNPAPPPFVGICPGVIDNRDERLPLDHWAGGALLH